MFHQQKTKQSNTAHAAATHNGAYRQEAGFQQLSVDCELDGEEFLKVTLDSCVSPFRNKKTTTNIMNYNGNGYK